MNTTENTLVENEVVETVELVAEKFDNRHNNTGRKLKTRNVMPINQAVYSGYATSFDNKVSFAQYNVTIGAFVEWAANKGVYNLLAKDVNSFLSDFAKTDAKLKTSKIHLGQFYKWMLLNGYEEKIQRSILIWLAIG